MRSDERQNLYPLYADSIGEHCFICLDCSSCDTSETVPFAIPIDPLTPYTDLSSNDMPQMQVYAVIAGVVYEGEDFSTLRLFDCKSTAVAYLKHLEDVEGFDYAVMETREVCMESALATA